MISSTLSYLSSALVIHITPEVTRYITGLVLMSLGFIFFIYFTLYAGFKGYQVISSPDLSGWDVVVRNLSELYFTTMLFLTAGVILTPGASPLYVTAVTFFTASALIMWSTSLIPQPRQSVVAGILLIIAAVLMIIGEHVGLPVFLESFPSISGFMGIGQLPGISRMASVLLIDGLFLAIAFILIGVALIVRGIALNRFTLYAIATITAAIGGITYASSLAYTRFSITSFLSELLSHMSWSQLLGFLSSIPIEVSGQVEAAFWTFYYISMAGYLIIGVAGILGLTALVLSIVFLVKSVLPSVKVKKHPPPPPEARK